MEPISISPLLFLSRGQEHYVFIGKTGNKFLERYTLAKKKKSNTSSPGCMLTIFLNKNFAKN